MKIYILKKYTICSFFILMLLIFLYTSINYDTINIFKKINIYATENKSLEKNSDYNYIKEDSDKEVNIYESRKEEKNDDTAGDEMINLLARLINGEARGEPYEGQVAVGAVILNRVKSPKFPNTIASVIYQEGQFTCIKDGQFNQPIDENSTVYKAAAEAMNGADPTNGALYFYNPSKTKSKWLFSLKTTTTIGKHAFALGE